MEGAIGMVFFTEGQGLCDNLLLNHFDENPVVKISYIIPISTLVLSISTAVESTHNAITAAFAETALLSVLFSISKESLHREWAFTDAGTS